MRPKQFCSVEASGSRFLSTQIRNSPLHLIANGYDLTTMHLPNRLWCVVPALLLIIASGCQGTGFARQSDSASSKNQTTTWIDSPFLSSTDAKDRAVADSVRVVDVAFEVMRVDLPYSENRHSLKLWNHVEELGSNPALVAKLKQNGLRVGVGSSENWAPIATILTAYDAKVSKQQMIAQRGLPLAVELDLVDGPESIFTFGADGRLAGKTFTEGKKIVNIDYAFHPELGGLLELQVTLEIRHDRGVMTWERTNEGIRQIPAFDSHVFKHLAFSASLGPNGFLVLGPSVEANNAYIVGSRFFSKSENSEGYETLLLIAPVPYQATMSPVGRK